MKAFWNGENTAEVEIINVRVLRIENQPLHWQNYHAGNVRQAVRVTQDGQSFIIDNETGTGFYKVTVGEGSPRCGHKSIADHEFINVVPKEEWKTTIDEILEKDEHCRRDEWMKKNYPEEFDRLLKLRSMAAQYGKDSGAESIGTPSEKRKIGRNEPCPCNSGKKYKRCHGSAF